MDGGFPHVVQELPGIFHYCQKNQWKIPKEYKTEGHWISHNLKIEESNHKYQKAENIIVEIRSISQ
jgi:hypothetical protein